MKLQIWDTAGQEHFRAVTRSYFRNAAGCILVYDVTRRQTFDQVSMWLNDIREQAHEEINICLVGNKSDLEDQRQVPYEEAKQWADSNGISHFLETSAKTGDNVLEAYTSVAQSIHSKIVGGRYNLQDKGHGVKANNSGLINLNVDASTKRKGGCC
ncbi:Rab family GTPase YPT1 [Sugiyamaella lignohabitans]|uniref:Rab family GTPase YPT1 n=1 Tax=Sugiyamaella lignohabitans TaxID=796027 RepID=A0A167BZI3_9ASCO|nr:Rab family GTPase YPT1 [Sugiyamaella lignohabitans]ANB11020.1 Rab family GTPase YPT1 [Sugiyamaella lignohabitans]